MGEALRVISTAAVKSPCRITYVVSDGEDGEDFVDFTIAGERPGTAAAPVDFGFNAGVLREFVRLAGQALEELDAAHK